MYEIDIKGDIIDDSMAWIYDLFEDNYASPKFIKNHLKSANNEPIKVKINSGGGSVFSASEIYTELKNYPNEVIVEIQGLCASASSVIAMAGSRVTMSPVAHIMIHNASCGAVGDKNDFEHTKNVLKNIDETIANAYVLKTNLDRKEILNMMNKETWLTAQKAKELGFIDEIIFDNNNTLNSFSNSISSKFNFFNSLSKEQLNNIKAKIIRLNNNKTDFFIQKINLNQKMLNVLKEEKNMKFTEMQLKEYNNLLNEAQMFLDSKDIEGYENKIKEIENFENECENLNRLQANLNAKKEDSRPSMLNPDFVKNAVFGSKVGNLENQNNEEYTDITNTMDYRREFMNQVLSGAKFTNNVMKTDDAGVMIPKILVEKIIEEIETYGNILNLVTKTSYKGGVTIPVANLNMEASWVGEGEGSTKQKKSVDGSVTFTYHKLRCSFAVTLETSVMSLSAFEQALVKNLAKAMTKALEDSILNGTGTNQPKGILTETVPSGQEINVSAINYETLVEAESSLPMEYENNAIWVMTKKTFMNFIGMTDANGQPIARVNYGISGKPERSLLGRKVELTNNLKTFDSASSGDVFAFMFDFNDYVLNTTYQVSLKRYEDNETDDIVTKSIMIVDGKCIRVNSLVTLKKQ